MDETIENPQPCHRCGGNGTEELHPCPYNSDINGDDTPCCNCCQNCCEDCAMDV
jgi:hypothetical protein